MQYQSSFLRFVSSASAEQLIQALQGRQYVQPHEALGVALGKVRDEMGICPAAIEQGTGLLHANTAQAIGRMRASELKQLARAIHRLWRQAMAPRPAPPTPV